MNFLEIVNTARSECGIAGGDISSVSSPTSREISRLIKWVQQSWVEIQKKRRDWRWLRQTAQWDTVAGKQSYTPAECGITRFGLWENGSFTCYLNGDASNELPLDHVTYDSFNDYYNYGTRRAQRNRPTAVAIAPDRSVLLGFTPDAVYTIEGDYYKSAQMLTADTDAPEMPEDFHYLIVYAVMQKYGLYEAAQEQLTAGKEGFAPLFNQLVQDQTTPLELGDSFI